jgi:phage terminase large subunit-like protein
MEPKKQAIRNICEKDFSAFAKLMAENHLFGDVHYECMQWLEGLDRSYVSEDPAAVRAYLLLIPRGHLKSFLCALFVCWMIAKHPCITIIYLCSTMELAKLQLSLIKTMLDSPQFRRYWPDHLNQIESKREMWASESIIIDHPLRKEMKIRDKTVDAVSLRSSSTGKHCDMLVCDDIVDKDNFLTEEAREQVRAADSQFTSVMNANAIKLVAGTRYHPADQYNVYKEMEQEMFDAQGILIGTRKTYEIFERVVETDGKFLWPRIRDPKREGKWEGYDHRVLAGIKASYKANNQLMQFGAQYYMDPNKFASTGDGFTFKYYDPSQLKFNGGDWFIDDIPLELACGADFAFTENVGSDYTAYAVVGVSATGAHYLLDIVQFKTEKMDVYWENFAKLARYWGFRVLEAEKNAGANVVLKEMQVRCAKEGLQVAFNCTHKVGDDSNKMDMKMAILDPIYMAGNFYHQRTGLVKIYEEQVTLARPKNDDMRDAVILAVKRLQLADRRMLSKMASSKRLYQPASRFGGRKRSR